MDNYHAHELTAVSFNPIVPAPPERRTEERQTTLSPTAQKMLAQMLDRYASSVLSRGNATLFTLK